ncbi:MAG: phosphatidate cytidylyltransferase [Gammaproteobacteria bacterium]|nr:phosphatidate cytidylyltransferase [Gammaproteobacteria bacterium]
MLKQRILTALVLIPITLLLLFYLPPAYFALLTALITLLAAKEWAHLMGLRRFFPVLLYVGFIALLLWASLFILVQLLLFIAAAWWICASLVVFIYPRGSSWWGKGVIWRGLMGVIVLIPCWVAFNYIRNQPDGIYALLYLFVLTWGADSAAYFVGKKWGKTKLLPLVSPGKTWEGLIGAVLFGIGLAVLAQWLCSIPKTIWHWGILLSMLTVLFSIMGDLFESALKRQENLKDSGQLLPGHGGLLDRIDSMTAAAPIFATGATLLGMYL